MLNSRGGSAEARDPPRGRSRAGPRRAAVRKRAAGREQPRRRARSLRPLRRGAGVARAVSCARPPPRRPPLGVEPPDRAASSNCSCSAAGTKRSRSRPRRSRSWRRESARSSMLVRRADPLRARRRRAGARDVLAAGDALRDSDNPQHEGRLRVRRGARAARRGTPRRGIGGGRAGAREPRTSSRSPTRSMKTGLVEAVEAALAPRRPRQGGGAAGDPGVARSRRAHAVPAGQCRAAGRAPRRRARHAGARGRAVPCSGGALPGVRRRLPPRRHAARARRVARRRRAAADEAQPLLAEARETFERLQATPWLERSANFVLQQH